MDAASTAVLLSTFLRLGADMQDRMNAGTITHDDIKAMLAAVGHTLDTWQAHVDASKGP